MNVIVFVVLIGVPAILLFLTWRAVLRLRVAARPHATKIVEFSPALVTVSFLWFTMGLYVGFMIGPYYGARRYGTIGANLVTMIIAALLVRLRKNTLRRRVVLCASLVGIDWRYLWAVNSVA